MFIWHHSIPNHVTWNRNGHKMQCLLCLHECSINVWFLPVEGVQKYNIQYSKFIMRSMLIRLKDFLPNVNVRFLNLITIKYWSASTFVDFFCCSLKKRKKKTVSPTALQLTFQKVLSTTFQSCYVHQFDTLCHSKYWIFLFLNCNFSHFLTVKCMNPKCLTFCLVISRWWMLTGLAVFNLLE